MRPSLEAARFPSTGVAVPVAGGAAGFSFRPQAESRSTGSMRSNRYFTGKIPCSPPELGTEAADRSDLHEFELLPGDVVVQEQQLPAGRQVLLQMAGPVGLFPAA